MNSLIALLPESGVSRLVCDAVWQSTLIGVVALIALRCVRHAAARAWIAVLACALCLCVPVASAVVRSYGYGLLSPNATPEATQAAADPSRQSDGAEPSGPIDGSESPSGDTGYSAGIPVMEIAPSGPREAPAPILDVSDGDSGEIAGAIQPVAQAEQPAVEPWMLAVLLWAVATGALLVRLLLSAFEIRRLCRDATVCEDEVILNCSRQAANIVQVKYTPSVLISARVGCPAIVSWMRPSLVIPKLDKPRSAPHWLSVFSHELAHVRRGDGWMRLLVEITMAAFIWQPLVWRLRREYHEASEEACDDWAVYAGADPLDYAEWLAEWIPPRPSVLATGIGGWSVLIRRRIERLVEGSVPSQPRAGWIWTIGCSAAAVVAVFGVAMLQTGSESLHANDDLLADVDRGSDQVADHATDSAEDEPTGDEPIDDEQQLTTGVVQVFGDGRLTHWNSATVLGFADDNKTLITSGLDGILAVWDMQTGRAITQQELPRYARPGWWRREPERYAGHYVDLALTPDKTSVVLAMADGGVQIVDLNTLESDTTLIDGNQPVALVTSGDGQRYAMRQIDGSIWVVAANHGTIVGKIPAAEVQADQRFDRWHKFSLNADGTRIATFAQRQMCLWDVDSGDKLWDQPRTENTMIVVGAFTPNEEQLICGGWPLRFLDAATGNEVSRLEQRSTMSAIDFSPDGTRIAGMRLNQVHVWDVASGRKLWSASGESTDFLPPTSVAFDESGEVLAAGFGSRIRFFDTESGDEVSVESHSENRVRSIAISSLGSRIALGDFAGRISVYPSSDEVAPFSWNAHEHPVDRLLFTPGGETLISAAVDQLNTWDPSSGDAQHVIQPGRWKSMGNPRPPRIHMTVDHMGHRLLTSLSFDPRKALVWDLQNGQVMDAISDEAGMSFMTPPAFTADGLLVAGRREPNVRAPGIWQPVSHKSVSVCESADDPAPRGPTGKAVAVSVDGNRVAFSVPGVGIRVWDRRAESTTVLNTGDGWRGFIYDVAFSPNGQHLASVGTEGMVRIWDVDEGSLSESIVIGPRSGISRDVEWFADGRRLLVANENGTAAIVRAASELIATR